MRVADPSSPLDIIPYRPSYAIGRLDHRTVKKIFVSSLLIAGAFLSFFEPLFLDNCEKNDSLCNRKIMAFIIIGGIYTGCVFLFFTIHFISIIAHKCFPPLPVILPESPSINHREEV